MFASINLLCNFTSTNNNNNLNNTKMTTLENTKTRKTKSIEVIYSNMTFVIKASCHYVIAVKNQGWTTTKYTATIKETGEGIGAMGGKEIIKRQMELINSRPDLFLK